MNILPKIRTRYGENIGVEIFVSPPFVTENYATFVAVDALSGVSTLTVDNGLKFSIGQYALLGSFGYEKSEIVRLHTSTAPTATLITLNAASNFAHNRGERIAFIPYDQIVIERSTDGGVNYASLVTVNIRPDSTETYYNHTTGAATDYYRARFSNSTTSDVSQYSDGIPGNGYIENSAGAVIRAALTSLGEEIDDVVTKEFLYVALGEGRTELDQTVGVERWSFRTEFDYNAGVVIPGQYKITLPADMREPSTYKNLLSVRIGRDRFPLSKVDKQALNRWYQGVARSTLASPITPASTSIVLTESGDFDDGGAINIAAASVSDELDVPSYVTNTYATNTLGTVTSIADSHAAGALVWQGASFGYPTEYTVDDGELIFSQPFANDRAGNNIWIDYYRKLEDIDSDADLLDEPNYKMYVPYLRYRIKKRRNKDLVRDTDDDYKTWAEKRDGAVQKEFLGQDVRLIIDIP